MPAPCSLPTSASVAPPRFGADVLEAVRMLQLALRASQAAHDAKRAAQTSTTRGRAEVAQVAAGAELRRRRADLELLLLGDEADDSAVTP
jgi:hypothetical protein